ncbi:MAG: VOC family protein [Alphaproteobacteria bacterium]|nr:VOC family protein [Alphaproteobacteria bacterium]
MLSHVSLGVRDLAVSGAFYDAALAPLGYVRVWGTERGIGYGEPGGNDRLAIFPQSVGTLAAGPGFHLALRAPDPASVDGFHAAALAHGGTDEGAPGLRAHYGPAYYAAFVRDPDGHKLEAVHQ